MKLRSSILAVRVVAPCGGGDACLYLEDGSKVHIDPYSDPAEPDPSGRYIRITKHSLRQLKY